MGFSRVRTRTLRTSFGLWKDTWPVAIEPSFWRFDQGVYIMVMLSFLFPCFGQTGVLLFPSSSLLHATYVVTGRISLTLNGIGFRKLCTVLQKRLRDIVPCFSFA